MSELSIFEMINVLDQLRYEDDEAKKKIADGGGTRVWLNGGINNTGSEKPTVITIYGKLSEADRNRVLGFAQQIDNSQPDKEADR